MSEATSGICLLRESPRMSRRSCGLRCLRAISRRLSAAPSSACPGSHCSRGGLRRRRLTRPRGYALCRATSCGSPVLGDWCKLVRIRIGWAMKLPRRNLLHLAAVAAALPTMPRIAMAQAYPSRPIHLILSTTPGGPADVVARIMGQWLSERLGQPFVIENRPGAGSNIGTEAVVRAPADGYTL